MNTLAEKAKEFFSKSRGSHGWDHTLRVYNLAVHICRTENADEEIIKAAALLHDIGRVDEDEQQGEVCHAQEGAKKAREVLEKLNYSPEKIEKIVHCIRTHRFRGNNVAETIEAKVLFDADKLDAIGAVGIGRAFLFAGEIGARLHVKDVDLQNTRPYSRDDTAYREFLVKLRKVRDRMLTKEGKRIAEDRHEFMEKFFERMNKEVDGKI